MRKLILLLTLILIATHVKAGSNPGNRPRISCNDTLYDFKKYSKPTNIGNVGYADYYSDVKRSECAKEWTVLIYMAADNDLSPYSQWDLYEMERKIKGELNLGASTDKLDVLVEIDTARKNGIRRLHMFQTNKEYDSSLGIEDFKYRRVEQVESPVAQYITEDKAASNQEKRLKEFLMWGVQKYPAKKYMVVIWGHGEGYIGKHYEKMFVTRDLMPGNKEMQTIHPSRFLSIDAVNLDLSLPKIPRKFSKDKVFGGVAFDYSDVTFLDIPTIKNVIEEVNMMALDFGTIDILTFDACLMQTVEVATELKDVTDYLVGSVQIQNYLGLPYRKVFDDINKKNPDAFELAKAIPKLADDSYRGSGYQGKIDKEAYKTFTASSISTSEMTYQLLPKLNAAVFAILEYMKEKPFRKMELDFILANSPTFDGETRDIGIFLGTVKMLLYEEAKKDGGETQKAFALRKKIDEALSGIQKTMVSYAYGSTYKESRRMGEHNYLLGFFKGLSVWLPRNKDQLDHRLPEFKDSAFFNYIPNQHRKNVWMDFLNQLFAGGFPEF